MSTSKPNCKGGLSNHLNGTMMRGKTKTLGGRFDREKFKELILFFAERAGEEPYFGATILNKMLFAADFLAFRGHGRSITGATYVHRAFGPAPKELMPVQRELESEGRLVIEERPFLGKKQKRPVASTGPDLSSFTRDELEICEYVLKFFSGVRAKASSEWSHLFPGYLLTEDGEEIPYFTALLGNPREAPITAADQKWAQELIKRLKL